MPSNFDEFSKRVVIVGKTVAENAGKVIRKAALAADQVAVLATPVDTGRCRAGWFVSVGAPSDQVGQAVGEARGADENRSEPNGANAAGAAQKALDQALEVIGGYEIGAGSIFLTNNVVYAPILDEGRVGNSGSFQAPNGMTAQAVQAAQEIIRKANHSV